jgi:hypothetical protein
MGNQAVDKHSAYKNGLIQLAQGQWIKANQWFNDATLIDTTFASAHFGKLLCELKFNTHTKNRSFTYPLVTDRTSYNSALQNADTSTKTALQEYAKNQKLYLDYEDAVKKGKRARSVKDTTDVEESFRRLGDYKDSKHKSEMFQRKRERAIEREHSVADYSQIAKWSVLILLGSIFGIIVANYVRTISGLFFEIFASYTAENALPFGFDHITSRLVGNWHGFTNHSPYFSERWIRSVLINGDFHNSVNFSIYVVEQIIYVFTFVFMFIELRFGLIRKSSAKEKFAYIVKYTFATIFCLAVAQLAMFISSEWFQYNGYLAICTVVALLIAWATRDRGDSWFAETIGYPILFTAISQLGIWAVYGIINTIGAAGSRYILILVPSLIAVLVVFVFLKNTVRRICANIYSKTKKRVFGSVLNIAYTAICVGGTAFSILAIYFPQHLRWML